MAKEKITSCTKFDEIFLQVLSKHAPLKSELLCANDTLYISKCLRKAIMKRYDLKNLYFKNWMNHSFRNYRKQKTNTAESTKKREKNFFNELNTSFMLDNK